MIGLAGLDCSEGGRIFNDGEKVAMIVSNVLSVTRRRGSGLSAKEFRAKYPVEVKLTPDAKKMVVEKLKLFLPSENMVLLDMVAPPKRRRGKEAKPADDADKLGGCFEDEEEGEVEPELEDAVSGSSRRKLFERIVLKAEEAESDPNKSGDLYTGSSEVDEKDEEDSEDEEDTEDDDSKDGEDFSDESAADEFDPDDVELINAGGEGIVSISSDLQDRPKIVSIREKAGLPTEKSDRTLVRELLNRPDLRDTSRCTIHGAYLCAYCFPFKRREPKIIADTRSCGVSASDPNLHERVLEIEQRVRLGITGPLPEEEEMEPEPTDELSIIAREVERIEKARLQKEEMERRKKVGKKRVRAPKSKETPNLRVANGFSTRQVATILDEPSFMAPFQVPDRTLLKDKLSIYHKWLREIEADAQRRCVPMNKARRRGDRRYESLADRLHDKVEVDVIDDKPTIVRAEREYTDLELAMVDGVLVTLDEPKTVEEKLPDGSTKIHIVKQLPMDSRIARRAGSCLPVTKTPSTYGELIESLPLKWVTIITKEEAHFYREYAARNLSAADLEKNFPELADDESRLQLENRIVRWGFLKRLLEPPLGPKYCCFERELDAQIRLDIIMISKTGGAYIGGGVYGSKLTKYGQSRNLTSFRTPLVREGWGTSSESDNGGPDYDDFGEESVA